MTPGANAGAGSGKRPASAPRAQGTKRTKCSACGSTLGKHLDRELTDAEVKAIDERLARFCYAEGLPFRALLSKHLHEALGKLNASWVKKSRLSDWNLRHSMLENEFEDVSGKVNEALASAFVLTLISDGWSGVQKEHELNILLATPTPFFVENIFTKARARASE